MSKIRLLALGALAVPTLALAQVGPNPAVPGGSQSPTVGGSADVMTAPQDAQIGNRATGNVLDRTIETRTDTTVGTGPDTGSTPTATPGADNTDTNVTGTTAGTGTRAKTRIKSMEKRRR